MRFITSNTARAVCLGLLFAGLVTRLALASDQLAQEHATAIVAANLKPLPARHPGRADFRAESASAEVRQMADWVVDSNDNRGLPFVILDKIDAKVFVFLAKGQLRAAAPALIGLAVGDDSVPGIGERKLSGIRPEERTTPAGRFVAALDRNLHGAEILWIDYEAAISLHPVITSNPQERRAERLATPTPLDNRISYGCVNVPADFFKKVIHPAFTRSNGIVYVLPETRSARQVFGSYDVNERARAQIAGQRPTTPQMDAIAVGH